MSNAGVGQRWARGTWLVGYNTFYDNLLDENLQRAGFGAEAWGEYLRLSANFYQPFAAWHEQTATQEQRMARGYDLTARMRMPFYQHLNTSVSVERCLVIVLICLTLVRVITIPSRCVSGIKLHPDMRRCNH